MTDTPEPVTEQAAFDAGYDAAIHGPNPANYDHKYFAARALTEAWQRGRLAGERAKMRRGQGRFGT